MPPSRLILAGYSKRSPSLLHHIAVIIGGTVADVRLTPYSSNPEWNGEALRKRMGGYYEFLPAWGNRNHAKRYESHAARYSDIEIANFEAGLARFEAMSGPVILLCACRDAYTCHRMTLARRLAALGYKYEHLRWDDYAAPDEELQTAMF